MPLEEFAESATEALSELLDVAGSKGIEIDRLNLL